MKPKVFIASPLFNEPQIEIIAKIEDLLTKYGYKYYSARKHSGSDKMTPEQRKDIHAWDPVFNSNEQGLNECRVMIAVLEYALPDCTYFGSLYSPCVEPFGPGTQFTPIELPDAGTVWECGYHRAQGKLVLGFHQDKAKHLNLMLTHGCDGMIRGWENLECFLQDDCVKLPKRMMDKARRVHVRNPKFQQDAYCFNWEHVEEWDASRKEVE